MLSTRRPLRVESVVYTKKQPNVADKIALSLGGDLNKQVQKHMSSGAMEKSL